MRSKRKPSSSHRPRKHGAIRSARRTNWPGRASIEDRWDRLIGKVEDEIRIGTAVGITPRFLSVEACWKRNVYAFTLANTKTEAESRNLKRYVEDLILSNEDRRLPDSPTFEICPFHWVFSALAASRTWEIDRRKVFRFGRHLLYAKQHRVPEEFLIGFLHQVGTPSEVEKKAGSGATEIWRDRWISASQSLN